MIQKTGESPFFLIYPQFGIRNKFKKIDLSHYINFSQRKTKDVFLLIESL